MNCRTCGAALPPHTDCCSYCGALNDTDLGRLGSSGSWIGECALDCPRCRKRLKRLRLRVGQTPYELARCPDCLGLFLGSSEELAELLDRAVPHLTEVDYLRLTRLAEERRHDDWPVQYIPCPACGNLMVRKNYGSSSGVVADWCRDHGLWLDGGELGQLVRWARAGGREKERALQEEDAARKQRNLQARPPAPVFSEYITSRLGDTDFETGGELDLDLESLARSVMDWARRHLL